MSCLKTLDSREEQMCGSAVGVQWREERETKGVEGDDDDARTGRKGSEKGEGWGEVKDERGRKADSEGTTQEGKVKRREGNRK